MSAIEKLHEARDLLDGVELIHSREFSIEKYLTKARPNIKVIRNQIVNSTRAKQWSNTALDQLKFPAAKDAFISWQRAMTGIRKERIAASSYKAPFQLIPIPPFPNLARMTPEQRKKAEEKYWALVQQIKTQNAEIEKEARRLNELYDKDFLPKIEAPLLKAHAAIKSTIQATVGASRSLAKERIDNLPSNSEDGPALKKRFARAKELETEMNAGGDATMANIGEKAWSTFMLCLKSK